MLELLNRPHEVDSVAWHFMFGCGRKKSGLLLIKYMQFTSPDPIWPAAHPDWLDRALETGAWYSQCFAFCYSTELVMLMRLPESLLAG